MRKRENSSFGWNFLPHEVNSVFNLNTAIEFLNEIFIVD